MRYITPYFRFDIVEVSSGLAPISLKDKVEIVKQVKKMGMKPKPKISMMYRAGAGTHIAGYTYQKAAGLVLLSVLLYQIIVYYNCKTRKECPTSNSYYFSW
jgi:(2R)-phospho-3-sulfolactate synthase (ComA)